MSDALLKLNIPAAGNVADISTLSPVYFETPLSAKLNICLGPIPRNGAPNGRLVAPISTVLYVPKALLDRPSGPESIPTESNIPKSTHWTECTAPGNVVLIKQPQSQSCALIGDLISARLKLRGSLGIVAAGRLRDIPACAALCEDGVFQIWSRGFSAGAPSLETVPWMVDVPLQLGKVWAKPGDVICADEGEMAVVVIPRDQLPQVFDLLPMLKRASDGVLADIENGLPLFEATKRHPDFYSNYK